jgi:hypothetical protein
MCRRVGNAFLLSAMVDDIGNGVVRTADGVRGLGRAFPGQDFILLVRSTSGLE